MVGKATELPTAQHRCAMAAVGNTAHLVESREEHTEDAGRLSEEEAKRRDIRVGKPRWSNDPSRLLPGA